MTTGKGKQPTLRQQIRDKAGDKLNDLLGEASNAVVSIVVGTSVDARLLMQLASQPSGGKTLRHNLVTMLANDAEVELVKLWNNQKLLDLGDEGED